MNRYATASVATVSILAALVSNATLAQEFEVQEDARDLCEKSMTLNAEKVGQNYSDLCVHDTRPLEFWQCVIAAQQEGTGLRLAEAQCEETK